MKTKYFLIAGVCVVVVLVVGYVVVSPYIMLGNIKTAFTNDDSATIAEYVDFPQLRQSTKNEINVIIANEMMQGQNDNDDSDASVGFAAIGGAFASMITDKLVDTYVTPEGVALLLQKVRSGSAGHVNLDVTAAHYVGLNRFVTTVRSAGPSGGHISFVFNREGLWTWKLTNVEAQDLLADAVQSSGSTGSGDAAPGAASDADAYSAYAAYVTRSKVSEGIELAQSVETAATETYQELGHFPDTSNATSANSYGLPAAASIAGKFVASIEVSGSSGIIDVRYNTNVMPELKG